jgi:Sodium/hydrogen exchanger family
MSIKALRANIFLSLAVALTGIMTPIALSFILKKLVGATSLQAFAAGAALSSTSLGTTFTVLSTTKLVSTRLGTVTTCAAMLDDVVGLIMVQVISNLGGNDDLFSAVTIIRPVFVSIGFAVGVFLLCAFCVKPVVTIYLAGERRMPFVRTTQFAFLAHTAVLFGIVAGASYAGTSSLFAAYLAGVIVSWFDELVESRKNGTTEPDQSVTSQRPSNQDTHVRNQSEENTPNAPPTQESNTRDGATGNMVYETYYKGPVSRILIPLFFVRLSHVAVLKLTNTSRRPLALRFRLRRCSKVVSYGAALYTPC